MTYRQWIFLHPKAKLRPRGESFALWFAWAMIVIGLMGILLLAALDNRARMAEQVEISQMPKEGAK
jgi:hypothetical protein